MSKSKNKKNKKESGLSSFNHAMGSFFRSSQFRAILGLVLLFFSLFMLLAMVSYLFTGDADQSFVTATAADREAQNLEAANWTGSKGAYVAEFVINSTFGISSFALVFLLVILAFLLLKINVKSSTKCVIYPILFLAWAPVVFHLALGYICRNSYINIGGAYGEWMSGLLSTNFGIIGEVLILACAFIIFGFCALGWHKYVSNLVVDIPKSFSNLADKIHNPHENAFEAQEAEPDDEPADSEEDDDVADDIEEFVINNSEDDDDTAFNNDDVHVESPENDMADSFEPHDDDPIIISNPADDDPVVEEPADDDEPVITPDVPAVAEEVDLLAKLGPYDPTKDLSLYKFPSPELLKDFSGQKACVSQEEQLKNQQKIINTLRNFNIGVKKIIETIGPTVTLFEIVPDDGVRVSKIRNLEKDIMLSLSATGIRLIAPMPGKGTIGIEVPNAQPRTVGMRDLILSQKFQNSTAELPVVMGRTITNDIFTFDLSKTPHLIVAGATGQGKSVGLNAIITSLLYKKHPSQLKFVLVDPKQLEFSIYSAIERHYLAKLAEETEAVITDSKKVVSTLEAVCKEMENRYYLLSTAKVRNIVEYNRKFVERKLNPAYGHRYLPYIVVIVDEFGDLIATEGKKIETPIQRITQKARAAGIHMILATQRPSVNVITGVIKANCPTRIAFRVISKIDSMTILDCAGADQLIGRGDMLYSKGDVPERVQCAFVDTPEVEAIVDHIHSQQSYPEAYELPEPDVEEGDSEKAQREFSIMHCDKLFNEVAEYVVKVQNGSTSNIQRNFDIGFNRAGRLMDDLESAGVVGPARGSKPREVLIKNLDELATLIASLQ